MQKRKLLRLITLSLMVSFQGLAQPHYMQQLRKINQQISEAYLQHDTAGILRIYAGNAIVMPEYHVTLFGKKAIADYRRAWLDSAKVVSYSRRTHDVTKTGDYLVETGTFSNHFTLRTKAVDYEGKYLNIWQIKRGGVLQLLSEIIGSSQNIERVDLPLSALQVPDTTQIPEPETNKTTAAIQALNDQVATLVVQRKGREFAKFYTEDAIYAPYYMPMQIGKKAIDLYYKEHEDPKSIIAAVHIGAARVISAGDYVLVNALYQVEWGGSTGAHGTVTGKNITVWKHSANGQLLMFRQMTVHD